MAGPLREDDPVTTPPTTPRPPRRQARNAATAPSVTRRPWIERIAYGRIALVLAALFAAVAAAAWSGGELFLAVSWAASAAS